MASNIKMFVKRAAFERLKRRVNKCIYYSDDCFVKLLAPEMRQISLILSRLYQDYLENKDDFDKHKGLYIDKIALALADDPEHNTRRLKTTTAKGTLWMLIPQFVHVKSYGYGQRSSRRYKLNQNGIELIEYLMKENEKIENGEVSETEQTYDDGPIEDEQVEEEDDL